MSVTPHRAGLRAQLEITGGIIRVYSAGSFEDGAPFDMALFLVGDRNRAILKGLATDTLGHAHRAAIRKCLRAHGFGGVSWERTETIDGRLVMRSVAFTL